VRDDLGAVPLLEEQAFEEIGGADDLPVSEREAQRGNAGVEVVGEALDDRRQQAQARIAISGHWVSGALLWRLGSRWTRQRWRGARGKQVSTARMTPGAPSVTANRGSTRPRRFRSSKKAVQLAVSSFVPGARWSKT
jgi:hypothetical protein